MTPLLPGTCGVCARETLVLSGLDRCAPCDTSILDAAGPGDADLSDLWRRDHLPVCPDCTRAEELGVSPIRLMRECRREF